MQGKEHKLLFCKNSVGEGFLPKRFVYKSHGASVPPSREELIEQEVREGVDAERTQINGFYLTTPPNPIVEINRLGVRTEIAATLRGQGMNDAQIQQGIIDERINQQLRIIAKHHVHEHHEQMGWVGKKLHSVRETISDISNPVRAVRNLFNGPNNARYNTAEERHLQHEMEHLFGEHRDVPHIVQHIVRPPPAGRMNPGHLNAAVTFFAATIGPPATPANLQNFLETASVANLEANLEHARRAPDRGFVQNYELLLNVRRVEARERSKILSIEIYDPVRLRRFLETMRTFSSDDYKMLTDILEKGALDKLDSDPAAQALVAHLTFLFESRTTSTGALAPDFTLVHSHLEAIRDSLPETKTKTDQPEAEKADNMKLAEKIDGEYKNFSTQKNKLSQAYSKTQGINSMIANQQARQAAQRAALAAIPAPPPGTVDPNAATRTAALESIRDADREVTKLEQSRISVHSEVHTQETEFKDIAGQVLTTLLSSTNPAAPPAAPPATQPELTNIHNAANETPSTLDQLFNIGGVPNSNLQTIVTGLNRNRMENLKREIDTNYKRNIKGREKISSRHLLVSLKDKRLQDQGVMDEGRRLKMAIFSANLMIADVKSVDLYRSANREIAETMITGWAGWRRRAGQSIASKFFDSNTFTARDMIDHVAGVDKEGSFEFLKGMDPESSLADLRHHIHDHHVGVDAVAGARAHLQKILEGMRAGHDRVEIADSSWNIENLIHNLLLIETELESRTFFDKVSNPATPEDKKLSKAEYLKKLWSQTHENDQKRQEGIIEKLKNFPNTLKKYLMKGVWGKQFDDGIKEAKENGLSGKAREEHLKSKGIPATVIKHLMTGLAIKEAYDIGKGTIGWVGGKLGRGAKHVGKFGAEKSGKLLSSAWNRLGKPALGATGRGVKRVGKFVAWDVPKFALWTTPKFFVWDAPKWGVKTTAKAVAWPFKMAGKALSGFWNFFHYTPEKAAKDAAKYGKKAAPAAGHGGGGHGGGH